MNAILSAVDKAKILHEAQAELQRHVWGTYIDKGVSVALGGNGIVTPGCEACRNTNSQYLQHRAEDVLPVILRRAFEIAAETTQSTRKG
jgi:hypothetical protein